MALPVSAAELSELLEASCDGLWLWEIPEDRVQWSDGVYRLLGRGRADRTYGDIGNLIHPEDLDAHAAAVGACLEGPDDNFRVQVRLSHADGRWLWVESIGHAFRDEAGRPLRMIGFLTERVEERWRLERLEASERRLREVMDRCPAGLLIKDAAHRHVYVNPALGALLGIEPTRLLGKTAQELLGEDQAGALAEVDERILEEGLSQQSEHHLRGSDGALHHVLDLKFPIPGRTPEERFLGGFVVDLTERDQREEQVRSLQTRIETMHRLESLGILAGGIAHDFNNLLVGILGSADLARSLIPNGEARECLDTIVESSRRAGELCEKLMTYAGGTRNDFQPTSASDLIHHLGSLFPQGARAFSAQLDEGLPAVRADRIQIRQVLSNLVLNAREATSEGGQVRIHVDLVPGRSAQEASFDWTTGRDAHLVRFSVQDDGEGMDEDQLRRIFDPFFSTKPSGHGLGLASVLGILRQHEAGLHVSSAVGTGTVFDVFLPLAPRRTDSATPRRVDEAAARVLVVDDESTVRRVLCRMLAQLQLSCQSADNGRQALEILQAEPPDAFSLVILDLNMPGLTGAQLINELRVLRPGLPVIISTGLDKTADMDEAVTKLPRLRKPYGFEDLKAVLRSAEITLP
ncbi:MAG: PAS domain S-box protein [Myxococcota bacterium]